jgi:hypothetical protein
MKRLVFILAILVCGCDGRSDIQLATLRNQIWKCSQEVHREYPAPRPGMETARLQCAACAYLAPEDTYICNYQSTDRLAGHAAMCVYLRELTLFDRDYGPPYPPMPLTEADYLRFYSGKVKRIQQIKP